MEIKEEYNDSHTIPKLQDNLIKTPVPPHNNNKEMDDEEIEKLFERMAKLEKEDELKGNISYLIM